jgi:aminoglycoside phosphotransferase family enzyme
MTHPGLLAAMSRPEFYPRRPAQVDFVSTHISFIFIAGDEVYKVKKAVDFGFLDFTTLDKRKFYCDEELRLNRRLAPETYVGVETITDDAAGGLALNGNGRIVEYAVRMKKLPRERMLGRLLAEGKCDLSVIDDVALKLADFHRRAETGRRIDARQAAGTDPSDGRWELFLAQKADFDPVTEFPAGSHIVLDTARPPDSCMEEALWMIRGFSPSETGKESAAGVTAFSR